MDEEISIHALREEGDRLLQQQIRRPGISIHALREEGDPIFILEETTMSKFLSTPSARRATMYSARAPRTSRHFYPRPPRGGRRKIWQFVAKSFRISIHALREEGDIFTPSMTSTPSIFLSTPSARRATSVAKMETDFDEFLSTPSARRATGVQRGQQQQGGISIHALREEGDRTA